MIYLDNLVILKRRTMQKWMILVGFLGVLLASVEALAEKEGKATISLTDGITISSSEQQKQEYGAQGLENKIRQTEAQQTKEDDGGFLSFLSFSFFSKNDEKVVEPEKNEKIEDFMTRIYHMAEQGDTNALMTLGYMYLYGVNGVEVNYKKAYEYYKLAAENGDSVAINNLGSLYYSGTGVRRDVFQAAQLFAQASDLGNMDSTLNLAVIYLSEKGQLGNTKEAVNLLKKAAEKNNPVGKYMLGYLYLKGIGIPKNARKAIENIRFAAEQNYDEAQYMMGYLYLHGMGVMQNYNNALNYLMRAYNQGNISAIYMIGNLYAAGTKIEPDFYKSYVAFNLCAYYGVADAAKKRDIVGKEKLKTSEILQAQTEAENFKFEPSPLTTYVKSTFGNSLALYIDKSAPIVTTIQE